MQLCSEPQIIISQFCKTSIRSVKSFIIRMSLLVKVVIDRRPSTSPTPNIILFGESRSSIINMNAESRVVVVSIMSTAASLRAQVTPWAKRFIFTVLLDLMKEAKKPSLITMESYSSSDF